MKTIFTPLLGLLACALSFPAFAQGTAFTYQGRLNDGANPASGIYDLLFIIYDSTNNPGTVIAGPLTNSATGVTNGLFTVTLDFGTNVFNFTERWLEIGARTNGNAAFVSLAPRQRITPTPYAIAALNAATLAGTLPASQLSGTIANGVLPSSPNFPGTVTANSFSGSGSNLSSLDADNISNGTLADARLSGNVALRTSANTFTVAQFFNGQIVLNSSDGFAQSSAGNFSIDAPFIGGGRFTVLVNGNVGIGTNNPASKLYVGGDATVASNLNLPAVATINAGTNRLLFADANQNFFAGLNAGKNSTNGFDNTASGYQALYSNASGTGNTAHGYQALYANTSAYFNTASGYRALYSNTGTENTANGAFALYSSTSGFDNTADGFQALYSNISGYDNTASGVLALFANTNGTGNTAIGYQALLSHPSGQENTAIGDRALQNNISGDNNIAIGGNAGFLITNGSVNIDIGNFGVPGDNNIIRIGGAQVKTFIAGISGATAAGGVQVFVNSSGQLGTLASSERFKQNIRGMGDESDVLLALRPVAFQYKPDIDPQGVPQFGLIAEEVDKVDPDLVARDDKNQIYTVRYQAVDAMLLNEFLKEHRMVEEQKTEIETLKQRLDALEKIILNHKPN